MMEATSDTPKPVVLAIMDGWGYRDDGTHNAISNAHTPVYDRMWQTAPRCFVATSSDDVGLPTGQMGNSEVGHMNIGAGRVVLQDLPRINKAILDDTLKEQDTLKDLIANTQASGGTVHLLGLLSPGGVHSHMDHMIGLAKVCADAGLPVRIHAFMDGRDTAPTSAKGFTTQFETALADLPDVRIATMGGRYFGMDRDNRWDRVAKAYGPMVDGDGPRFETAQDVIEAAYAADTTDEFIEPAILGDYAGMQDGDALLMANFRADRVREILAALVTPDFDGFDRQAITFSAQVGMVSYAAALDPYLPALFPPVTITESLGEVVSKAGLKQLRIAETEKYPHVTYFLNAGEEEVYTGEDRILVPSPDVATYDLKPEMSAAEVTDHLVEAIEGGTYSLIVVNYANGDMVGHTGVYEAAVKAIETLDTCLGRLLGSVDAAGGVLLVTADHGNAELMVDLETGDPHTQHTNTPVPLLATGDAAKGLTLQDGRLADIAPTILSLMKLPQPAVMTGASLIARGPLEDAAE